MTFWLFGVSKVLSVKSSTIRLSSSIFLLKRHVIFTRLIQKMLNSIDLACASWWSFERLFGDACVSLKVIECSLHSVARQHWCSKIQRNV